VTFSTYFLGLAVALVTGLDRMAAFQVMISRPLVAAPLTGLVLGDPLAGLTIGALLELLWLARIPVGASIPPDDTQIAVAATALCLGFVGDVAGPIPLAPIVLALMVAIPLGKIGELFDRMARHRNLNLVFKAEQAVEEGAIRRAERCHLLGFVNFALAAASTYSVIYLGGAALMRLIHPLIGTQIERASSWLILCFPLVGAACILASINVCRAMTLFFASFISVGLLLWLI